MLTSTSAPPLPRYAVVFGQVVVPSCLVQQGVLTCTAPAMEQPGRYELVVIRRPDGAFTPSVGFLRLFYFALLPFILSHYYFGSESDYR